MGVPQSSAGSAALRVVPQLERNFSRNLLNQMHGPTTRAAEKSGREGGRKFGRHFGVGVRTGIGPVTGIVRGVGVALAGAFGAAIVARGIKSTIDAASDLNESMSKSQVVFGKSAKAVAAFAKGAARNLGMSRQQALEATATFGNLFVSMKLGQKPAADMSTKIVKLASDLASFNNVKPEEALEALRAGLVGETEPLRKFGINLNDASLRQEALRLGLMKTTKEVLPPAIKAQAAYSLIMQQSKTAQGDFARTSKGAANQQRIFAARIQDLKASIGQGLLPAFNAALRFINERLIPGVSGFATKVKRFVVPTIKGLTVDIQERLDGFKPKFNLFKTNLIIAVKDLAVPLVAAFTFGLETANWRPFASVLGDSLQQIIGDGVGLFQRAFSGVDWLKLGKALARVALPFIVGFVNEFGSNLIEFARAHPMDMIVFLGSVLAIGKIGGIISKLLAKIPFLRAFAPLFKGLNSITEPVNKVIGKVVGFIGTSFIKGFAKHFPEVGGRLGRWVLRWTLGISGKYGQMRKAAIRFITGLIEGVGSMAGRVSLAILRTIERITRPFRTAGRWLIRRGVEAIAGLVRGIVSMLSPVTRATSGIITRVTSPFRTAGRWLAEAGRDIVRGLRRGIDSVIGTVGGVLRRLKDAIVGGLKRLFGIRSPSTVMAGLGANLVAGLVRGIVTNRGSLRAVVKSIGGDVIDWLGSIFGGIGAGPNIATGGIQKLAQRMAAGYGWTGGQWAALRTLVQNESGWNPNAQNPTSTAYGLFQFLDSTWGSVGAVKTSSPVGQISAGLRYIKQRYGSPAAALGAWQSRSPHWYGEGGIFKRPTIIGVGERGPEAVVPLERGMGNTYHIEVKVPPTADLRSVGAAVVKSIEAYEHANGKTWRTR